MTLYCRHKDLGFLFVCLARALSPLASRRPLRPPRVTPGQRARYTLHDTRCCDLRKLAPRTIKQLILPSPPLTSFSSNFSLSRILEIDLVRATSLQLFFKGAYCPRKLDRSSPPSMWQLREHASSTLNSLKNESPPLHIFSYYFFS